MGSQTLRGGLQGTLDPAPGQRAHARCERVDLFRCCTNPVCIDACPNNALFKREEGGIVVLDQRRCRGHLPCPRTLAPLARH